MTDRLSMHRSTPGFLLALGIGIAVAGLGASARAADSTGNARAARLTYLQGTVTVDRADNSEPQPAQINLPLLAGVRLATGDDGQAEVEFEDGSLVRLTPNSALALDNLTVEPGAGVFTTGLRLLHGLAYLELRATPQYRYTLDAGGDVLSPVENTTVRVNLDEPPAVFAVLDGTARVERLSGAGGAGYQRELRAGESLRGDPANPALYALTPEIAEDSWDTWNEDRDQAAAGEAASRTAARDNFAGAQGYGWSDLDANGSWYDVPGQGPVWQPQIASDSYADSDSNAEFDPYGNGAWVWYPGTGYLWASGYAWGWTPYRCGNWSYFNGFGWGWTPVAGCGGFGWGFWGGGRPVNILREPNGYRIPHVPRPGGPRPTPRRAGSSPVVAQPGPGFVTGPRRIDGVMAMPLEPVGSGYASRDLPGSALQRDFPVDRTTHAPIAGRPSTQPGAVHTAAGWRSTGVRPATAYSPQRAVPSYSYPNRGASSTTPVVRSAPPQAPRPAYTPAPVQRSAPPAPSRPAGAPAPARSPR